MKFNTRILGQKVNSRWKTNRPKYKEIGGCYKGMEGQAKKVKRIKRYKFLIIKQVMEMKNTA